MNEYVYSTIMQHLATQKKTLWFWESFYCEQNNKTSQLSLVEKHAILNETFEWKFYLDESILTLSYTNLFSGSMTKCLHRYFVNAKAL